MSIQGHIVELERKHQSLEKALGDAKNHPAVDAKELAEIKRKKLKIKDELNIFKEKVSVH